MGNDFNISKSQEANGIVADFPRGVAPYNFPVRGPAAEYYSDPTREMPSMVLAKPAMVPRVLGNRDKRHQKKER